LCGLIWSHTILGADTAMTSEERLILAILIQAIKDAGKKRKPDSQERCAACFLSNDLFKKRDSWTKTMLECFGEYANLYKLSKWADKYGIHTCGKG